MSIKPFRGSAPPAAKDRAAPAGLTQRLAPSLDAPAQARAIVASRFGGRVPADVLDDALLVVSELVTNAVTHGRGELVLQADLEEAQIRGRVMDHGSGFDHEPLDPGVGAIGGRGLFVVDRLCRSWGVRHGFADVWFVLDVVPRSPSAESGEGLVGRRETPEERDRAAEARDRAAESRDRLADALQEELERRSRSVDPGAEPRIRNGVDILFHAARDRRRAEDDRRLAAQLMRSAAADRRDAAADREQAARDRDQAKRDRLASSVDELTSTLRRGPGLAALEREIERALRTRTTLTVAYVDIDGLKAVNDLEGHAAGDAVLSRVGRALRRHLRPYDLTVRLGGDEFLCAIPGAEPTDVRRRLADISDDLRAGSPSCAVTAGLTDYRHGESAGALISRADAELLASRRA